MTDLPTDDQAPDFPPGPTGPEDRTPGQEAFLTPAQAAIAAEFIVAHPNRTIGVRDRGAGWALLVAYNDNDGTTVETLLSPTGEPNWTGRYPG